MVSESPPKRQRVAILGGGVAGLAAAAALTKTPDCTKQYDVFVIQAGWAPGGKLASGRNAEPPWRIEEHGLHMLLGFYDNTIALLRETYDQLGLDLDEAFEGVDRLHLIDEVDGQWVIAPYVFSPPPKLKQLPPTPRMMNGGVEAIAVCVKFVAEKLERSQSAQLKASFAALRLPQVPTADQVQDILDLDQGANAVAYPALVQSLLVQRRSSPQLMKLIRDALLRFRAHMTKPIRGTKEFYEWVVEYIAISVGIGLAEVDPNGNYVQVDDLDGIDFRAWLKQQKVDADVIDSALVSAGYNLVFARDGQFSTAVAIRGGLLMITKGGYFYRPNATMAEALLAPLYRLLRHRGVRFAFYSKVVDVVVEDGQVSAVYLDREADVGLDFNPLMPHVKGDPLWRRSFRAKSPDPPLREPRRIRLENGRDFDKVLLAIPLPGLPDGCPSLLRAHDKLRAAVEQMGTIATCSAEIYLSRSLDAGSGDWQPQGAVLANCLDPFQTFADMAPALPVTKDAPRGLVYLCGVTGDSATALQVEGEARAWIDAMPSVLWPASAPKESITGIFGRANVAPGDRYIQCRPGTASFRVDAGGCSIGNLFFAGDWTKMPNNVNAGCLETGVTSGLVAAEAIQDSTRLERVRAVAITAAASGVPFIAAPDDWSWPGPFIYNDSTLYSFFIQSDLATLQSICDFYLNLSQDSRGSSGYRVIAATAMVQCAQSTDAQTKAVGFPGFLRSKAIALTLPVAYCTWENGRHVPQRLRLFTPYIFADKAVEVAAGRETFGVSKRDGVFATDNDDWLQARNFSASSGAIPLGGGELVLQPILGIACSGDGSAQAQDSLTPIILDIYQTLTSQNLLNPELSQAGFNTLLTSAVAGSGSFGLAALKQFRDSVDNTKACFQQVVEVPLRWQGVPGGAILDPTQFTVTFPANYQTCGIPQRLNLPVATPLPVIGAYRMDFAAYIMG